MHAPIYFEFIFFKQKSFLTNLKVTPDYSEDLTAFGSVYPRTCIILYLNEICSNQPKDGEGLRCRTLYALPGLF